MQEKRVSSEKELESAVNAQTEKIIIEGDLAEKFIAKFEKKQKVKKVGKVVAITGVATSIVAIVAGVVLSPATGGASLAGTAFGLAHVTVVAGGTTVTASVIETLGGMAVVATALGCSTFLLYKVFKNYDVKIVVGKVEVELNRKQGK